MMVKIPATAVGKRQGSFKGTDGNTVESFTGNISQDNGSVIGEIRLTKEQYEAWEAGRNYMITGNLNKGNNGLYLQILQITPEPPGKATN